MNPYTLQYTPQAMEDIDQLVSFIRTTCSAPLTAKRYAEGLFSFIETLHYSAHVYAVSTRGSVLRYGSQARCIHYKRRISVIYTIHQDKVIIHRVIPAALIKE